MKDPKCFICHGAVITKKSKHIFLDLEKCNDELNEWYKTNSKGHWTNNSRAITDTWFKMGLKPRCITRDLKWGIPVPEVGFEKKCFYVWFDAPIGYISITANYTDEWRQWW